MQTINQEQLLAQIDFLPIDLKTKIVDKILSSLNKTDKKIEDLWIKEANRRLKEIENGKAKLIEGEEVFLDIKKRFQ